MRAMRPKRCLARLAVPSVLGQRADPQVQRVDAVPHVAQVIDLHAPGDRAVDSFGHDAVHVDFLGKAGYPITVATIARSPEEPLPQPAVEEPRAIGRQPRTEPLDG